MLAVFGKQRTELGSPLSPGTKRKASEQTPEDEDFVTTLFDNLYSSLPRRLRGFVSEQLLGGPNGIAYVESMRHQLATDGDISVFFKGELADLPDDQDEAEYVLHQYRRTWGHALLGDHAPVMEALGQLEGSFAFVVYDKSYGRIVAARDVQGVEPLLWGTTMLSDGLLFASDRGLIEGECVDADDFPAGMMFVSHDFSTTGSLTPIRPEVQEAPKELCRVESKNNMDKGLGRVESSTNIAAQ